MTDAILIKPGVLTDHHWNFEVHIDGARHLISVSQDYWRKMTRGDIPPMDLVRIGLGVVVKHHKVESLPGEFDLEVLAETVPDFVRHTRAIAQTEGAGTPR